MLTGTEALVLDTQVSEYPLCVGVLHLGVSRNRLNNSYARIDSQ